MIPTFFDLAVAMNRLDIERESQKLERIANLMADDCAEGIGNKLGRLFGGIKSRTRQSSEVKGQTSSSSMA